MPPWPSRLHLGSPATSHTPCNSKGKVERNLQHPSKQLESGMQDPPLLDVPILDSVVPPLSKNKPRHGRSLSNPFTVIFGSGKKTGKVVDAESEHDAPHTLDSPARPSTRFPTKDVMAGANGISVQHGSKDFVTGKCRTCDCAMKWPRQVDSYRCQICLMINDLKPSTSLVGEFFLTENPSSSELREYPSLSLDKTRRLIDDCLFSYLQSCLDPINSHSIERHLVNQEREVGQGTPINIPIRSGGSRIGDANPAYIIPSPTRAPPPLPPTQANSPQADEGVPGDSQWQPHDPSRSIFRSLENYIIACFTSIECLNTSFVSHRGAQLRRTASESTAVDSCPSPKAENRVALNSPFPELDAKTLLLGDFAENGMWWTGKGQFNRRPQDNMPRTPDGNMEDRVTPKTPRINWAEVNEWYIMVVSVGRLWRDRLQELKSGLLPATNIAVSELLLERGPKSIEKEITEACAHVQRTLLKASENILRRPGRPLRRPEDCRFLLILLANPLLHASDSSALTHARNIRTQSSKSQPQTPIRQPTFSPSRGTSVFHRRSPSNKSSFVGMHSGIVKRILGLLANLPSECHRYLVTWFSQFSEPHFRRLVDLVGNFVTYRLSKQHGRKRSNGHDPHGGLIPNILSPGAGTSAQLHAAIGVSGTPQPPEKKDGKPSYENDWQIKAAAKVMSLLFSANILTPSRLHEASKTLLSEVGRTMAGSANRIHTRLNGQLLPTNAFYNTLLDRSDLVADFEAWESRKGKFSFCQYPLFLSIWAKIHIMEYDVRRQMEIKAREAFFNSILNRRAVNQYLVLKVRRDCLVEDSLRSVSEVVGTGQDEIKKGLRIDFVGEEGLDSGGLRKEWFLLLVRDVFDPEHGLFVYDEESRYCYFNPNSFETSDQFFLVGVVLGLAIYNSTILDIALPPFAFRKLLASAPNYTGPTSSSVRSTHTNTLLDLAEFRPSLARGLKQMLDFDGSVEETYCWDFVAVVERYGHMDQVPLCSNGENRPVTNSNRYEFVDLYVKYMLDASVTRQYEPFKRGFFSVCEGNALSLFRPEEIELLVRGSDERLDVTALRTVAIYEGWGKGVEPADEPVVAWFWESFSKASAKDQRKMLSFITASDRIPAMGAMCLTVKISCLGDHSDRLPIARTCFNMLGLYRYRTMEVLENKLWKAVNDSEGFGMK